MTPCLYRRYQAVNTVLQIGCGKLCVQGGTSVWEDGVGWCNEGQFEATEDAMRKQVEVPAYVQQRGINKRLESYAARYCVRGKRDVTMSHEEGVAIGVCRTPNAAIGADIVDLDRIRSMCGLPFVLAALEKRALLRRPSTPLTLAFHWSFKEALTKALLQNKLYSMRDISLGDHPDPPDGVVPFTLHERAAKDSMEIARRPEGTVWVGIVGGKWMLTIVKI
eukprot:TRINITY_DN24076_c0_g1_i1.p1 TRINITY_DN24076_c0_g1~~TRINITY_DN24076_c0_g1_i1.p1  ORF type:complete len:238 (+),score=44.56 TRINITY_DN24076_c0_g1_i1:54-716(+)